MQQPKPARGRYPRREADVQRGRPRDNRVRRDLRRGRCKRTHAHHRAHCPRHDRIGYGRRALPLCGACHGLPRTHALGNQDSRQPSGGRVHRGPRPALHQHREPAAWASRGHFGIGRHRSHHGTPMRPRGHRGRRRLRAHALRQRLAPQRQKLPRGLRYTPAPLHHRHARHRAQPRGGRRSDAR